MPEASGSRVTDEPILYENKNVLAEDMKFLAGMPELCDVTFLVGDTREPVCAVKAVLAARSRVFHKMLYQAPSPQRKKDPPTRENKIRMFLKRSSEPLLNLQNAAQQPNQHTTLIIEEFEADVFRQVIEYIHTGCIMLQPRTLLGVMNAADYYGLNQLRSACAGFAQCCITVDTVCALLASAERYIQYKCTKSLVQKVLEFVDEHGNEVLNLGSFTLLPQHVVLLILAREELRADEFTKFQAALMWSKKFCDSNQTAILKDVIAIFLEYIQFHKIPTNVLMKEIHPLDLVPSGIIMKALAYQADPSSVEPEHSPHRVRRTDRTLSVQSSPDQYDSKTTLSSSGSDAGSDQKQHSGKNSTAEQESIGEQSQSQQHHHQQQQQHQSRQEPKTQKQQEEEEDLQQKIRIQLQMLRQELEMKRQIEEAKIHEREEELKRQQQADEAKEKDGDSKDGKKEKDKRKKSKKSKKELKKELKKREQEEAKELKRQQEEQEMLKKLEADIMKKQKEEEEYMKSRQKEEMIKTRQREDEMWTRQKEEELRKQEKLAMQQEQIEKSRQKEEEEARRQQEDAAKVREDKEKSEERSAAPEEVPKEPEDASESKELPRQNEREKEEQQKLRRDMRLQLQLQDLKQYSVLQQQLELQKQEEALLRQIEEKRREELREAPEFQLFQLYLEGRKPEAEKRAEERQAKELERKEKKKKEDRVKVRVKKPEAQKRDQQDHQPQELPVAAPREGVSGFYIRLVVTQGGGRNLIWLLKTHMF
ncbi:uncharacterized protein LOC117218843 isoform X2 [Megalopta genalis]|uniref:uncharacterized protein LOC117218843 isoform X2 n=1 Tax=Megalopta genalis TaxID=115081 RepID=UPI0014432FE3|nr:golgin subfamily A member 6-like protein 22 isoform X2 [Megalopta genalis]